MFPASENFGFDLNKHTILYGLGGSHSYGTSTPESDIDYRGIFLKPLSYYFTIQNNIEQIGWKIDTNGVYHYGAHKEIPDAREEAVLYTLEKFFPMAMDCNPNILEILYLDEKHYRFISPAGQLLIDNRSQFLTQKAFRSFFGYAYAQLHRIEGHRKWLLNPPKEKPTRESFGLKHQFTISKEEISIIRAFVNANIHYVAPWLRDQHNDAKADFWNSFYAILALMNQQEYIEEQFRSFSWETIQQNTVAKLTPLLGFDTNFIECLNQEKAYYKAIDDWEKYQHWKTTRNPARAELEAKYGYDTKHAMHLVRLLRMAEEILTTNYLTVYRPDREFLKEIRRGVWTYDELISYIEEQKERLSKMQSTLPLKPNYNFLQSLYQGIIESYFNIEI